MTNKIAVYAGTFDPITLGHVDIIKRASVLFDQIIVGVAKSERKKPFFSLEQRIAMAQAALSDIKSVEVKQLTDLTVHFAKEHDARYLVRGLRSVMDYDYEAQIAQMNRNMSGDRLETVFLPTHPDYAFISSSIVRELILIKAFDQVSRFVPPQLIDMIQTD